MIRVKMLSHNEVCVIDNGKSYVFNQSGLCYKEDAGLIPQYTTGMLDLPIISILSANNQVEIALFEHDTIRKYVPTEDSMTCALKIQMTGRVIRMLNRNGKLDNNRFNQLLFIYAEGTNLQEKLQASKLQVKEVQ